MKNKGDINKEIEKKFRKELMEAYEQAASIDDASDIECAIRRGLSFILSEVIPMVRKDERERIRGIKIKKLSKKDDHFEIPDDMEDFDLNGDRIPIKKIY